MVKKVHNTTQKHFTYKMYNVLDHIESKSFHMIKDNKKEVEGQLLSSLHYNVEFPIAKDLEIVFVRYNENKNSACEFKTIIPSYKLICAYNDLKSKNRKHTDIFVTTLSHFSEFCESTYSMYIDFQVFPSNERKDDYVCLTLPSFKIYYY